MLGRKNEEGPRPETVRKNFEDAPPQIIEPPKEEPPPKQPHLYAKVPLLLIREARESDETELYQLGKSIPELQCKDGEDWLTKEDVHHRCAYDKDDCLVALLDDKMIAFLISDHEGYEHGCITFLGVHPDYRNEGIATYLLSQMEARKNYKDWYLFATSENAVKYFESQGYVKGKTMTYMLKKVKED